MIKTEVKLVFPDLFIDASDIQLGATIFQDEKPLGFYKWKLSRPQRSYTVGKKELIGIMKGLKAFSGVTCGQDLIAHTDHLVKI